MILLGHLHIKCSLTQRSHDHVYFNSSNEIWSILSESIWWQRKIVHYHFQLFAPFARYPVFRMLVFRPEKSSSQRQNGMWKKPLSVGSLIHGYWLSWSIKIQNKPCDIGGPDGAVTPVQMMGPVSAGDLLWANCRTLFPSPHPRCCLHLLTIRITARGEKYISIKSIPEEVNMRPTNRVDIWWHQWNMRWWNVVLTAV